MTTLDRRDFLRAAGAAALAVFPPSIRRALAIPANNATGTINDVQHVVILMQENRSFDHYFGTMPGVRGFADRFTIPQPEQASVFEQSDGSRIVTSYYEDPSKGNGLGAGGPHGWEDSHSAWDSGRMTHWPQFKTQQSMGYLTESELGFQFALANAFTLCDNNHCAIHSSTNPNRTYHWTGTCSGANSAGVQVSTCLGNNGWDNPGGTPLTDSLNWTTYPERLEKAGVSWKVYVNNPNNYTDNPLAGFLNYRNTYQAVNGTLNNYSTDVPPCTPYTAANGATNPLYKGIGNTMPSDLGVYLDAVRADVAAGTLPQVSWVIAPETYSEHPANIPQQGAWYVQQLFDILTSNADTWSKTVLIINYDENDGFFDHMPPPDVPSRNSDGSYAGKSTVDTTLDYFNVAAANAPYAMGDGLPYGPGQRVPLFIVSPWTTGGWINSQLFDHTSVLRFLEARFGIAETNITPWRRTVMGDLTSAFNFATPNDKVPTTLPPQDQAAAEALYLEQTSQKPVPPPSVADQRLPVQVLGVKPSRALPYELHVSANAASGDGKVWLVLSNTGTVGAVFHVYDKLHLDRIPRRYTVEAGKELSDAWDAMADDSGNYDLWVLGPNGFHRAFQGSIEASSLAGPEIRVCYDTAGDAVYLTMMNSGHDEAHFFVIPNAYRTDGPWHYTVPARSQIEPRWSLAASSGWYDFTVTADNGFVRRFAGRMETGKDSISDPAMGNG